MPLGPGDTNYSSADQLRDMQVMGKLRTEANKSLAERMKLVQEIEKLHRAIIASEASQLKLDAKIQNFGEAKTKEQKAQLEALNREFNQGEKIINQSKDNLVLQRASLRNSSKISATVGTIVEQTKNLGNLYKQHKGWFFEQEKAIKETELNMGVLGKQAGGFRDNIYKTSLATTKLGVDSKDLAKIQGTYADTLGRAVQLSEEQLTSVAELAKGTVLGAEGAAEFAANMDSFGVSTEDTVNLVERMNHTAHKMGVSSGKMIKNVAKHLKIAQKFHFKDGVEGLGKMVMLSDKFKLSIEGIAGFAEKLFTPEGAIEVAAQLQVLGGAWAKLADPFELMYRARNDMEGLTEDIIDATKETARFNKETGEFTIDPMELHRLREIAKVTGQSVEELSEAARISARLGKISGSIIGNFDDEERDFISSLSTFNSKTKGFDFTFVNEDGLTVSKNVQALGSLTSEQLQLMITQKQTLEDNALQAQTFDDSWTNLINTIKSTFLPAFTAAVQGFQEGLNNFTTWAKENKIFERMASTLKTIGKFIGEHPIESGIALALGNMAIWVTRGSWLGMGFRMTAGMGGGAGGGMTASKMAKGRNIVKHGKVGGGARNVAKGAGRMAKGAGKMAKGVGRASGVLAGIGAGVNAYENFTDDDLTGWEAALKTLDQNKFLAIGAALAPFTGGASLSLGMLDMVAPTIGDYEHQDFISRPGSNPVSFSGSDTLIGAKKGGPIDKLLDNSSPKGGGSGSITVSFGAPLRIEGSLKLESGSESANIDLDNPILMREISKVIQEQLTKSISGGKMSSNPAFT